MEFKNKTNKGQKHELLLLPKSLTVINGKVQHNWTHGIPAKRKDRWKDKIINRTTRVSLTFRNVILVQYVSANVKYQCIKQEVTQQCKLIITSAG
jgi:hypothetical protein